MKTRHLLPSIVLAVSFLASAPSRAQLFVIEGLNELSAYAQRVHDDNIKRLQEARRERSLEKYRAEIDAIWRETTPAKNKLSERLGQARTALAAKKSSLADYERQYGAPEGWPPEHQAKAKELLDLGRAVAQLENSLALVTSVDDRARKIGLHLQTVTGRGFAEGFKVYDRWADELAASIDNMRGTLDGLKASWTATPAPPIRVRNETAETRLWVNGERIDPGQDKRIVAPTGSVVTIHAVPMTERRKFILDKGEHPTPHTTLHEASPWILDFTIDTGAGATRTTWKSDTEAYTWSFFHDQWKVDTEVSVGDSGEGPKGDVLRFKVPYVPKDRFGERSWLVYTLGFRGDVRWLMTRRGAMTAPDKTEEEKVPGGSVVIEVFAN